jgi:peptidoglycan hydrolase-like protein with peptidoglycan-binding domain
MVTTQKNVKKSGLVCRGWAVYGVNPVAVFNSSKARQCTKLEVCEGALLNQNSFAGMTFYPKFYANAAQKEARRRGYSARHCFNYLGSIFVGASFKTNEPSSPLRKAFIEKSPEERMAIQEGLADLNFYTSTIDGLYGRNTEAAIKAFTAAHYDNIEIGTEALASILLKRILNFKSCDSDATSCTDQQICRFATVWSDNQKSWSDGPYKTIAEERGLTCGLKIAPDTVAKVATQFVSDEIEEIGQNSSTVPLTIDIVDAFYKSEDYKNALTYASILAIHGNGKAHRVLGDLYANGRGVLQLNQNAHMWYNIAALHGDTDAMAKRDTLSQTMTSETLAEAQSMALTCIQSNFKDCGLVELPEQVKIAENSPQQRPNNQPALIDGSEFQYSFASQSTLRRKQLQYAFKQLGLYSSSIDGIWGRGTSQAITNYIKLNDLQPRNGEELYMDVLSKVPVPNSFASNNARNVNRNTSNNAANRAAQQRQADMLINLGTSLMNSATMPSSPSRSIDCYTYGNYTTCN